MSDIKFEAGRFYKTKDGRKVAISAIIKNPFIENAETILIGYLENDKSESIISWFGNGRYNIGHLSDLCIVDEWK